MYASDGLNGKIGCLGKPLFQNPVVEGKTVICIFIAQVLDRAVLVERLERLGHGVGRLGVALLKADGVVLAGQRLIKLCIGIGLGGKLILGNREVTGDGIDCTTLSNDSHIWTVATLDGTQVHIDTTWGDAGPTPDYAYFAMTPSQSWTLHSW